ncbi:MAG: 2-oxoacid:acceptor oxidoreductase subunit alpha [Candidatus Dormibacteria bacterium]
MDQIVGMDLNLVMATVNGSGSQSANLVLTRALFAMGVPVAPKNIFPSNIEGLPTWFFLRATSAGHLAGRRKANLLVALNRATYAQDVARVERGGVLVFEQAYGDPAPEQGAELITYPVPFGRLAKEAASDPDLRKYLTNMIYVGVVAEILGLPEEALESALSRQFRGKPRALPENRAAIQLGRSYFRENLTERSALKVRPLDQTQGKLLLEGNQAVALGALMGGCTVFAWYPITPSSSVADHLSSLADRMRVDPSTGERRIAVVQAEDELAAAGMVIGAGWAGARSMTATSGPGISLMAEFVGLAYFAEIPSVFVDIQRVGPSTGLPTRTMQGDLSFTYTLSHGDTRHPILLPGTVLEAYSFAQMALDLAERIQTPIFVLSDLDLGMNLWMTDPPPYPDQPFDRGKVLREEELKGMARFERYRDLDGDGIAARTLPGTRHPLAAYFTRGSGHDEAARYTESEEAYPRVMDRLRRKLESAVGLLPQPVEGHEAAAEIGIIAYGSSDAAVAEARSDLSALGTETGYLRIRSLPPGPSVAQFLSRHQRVYLVEQNRDAQMLQILRSELDPSLTGRIRSVLHYDGFPLFAADVLHKIREGEGEHADQLARAASGAATGGTL